MRQEGRGPRKTAVIETWARVSARSCEAIALRESSRGKGRSCRGRFVMAASGRLRKEARETRMKEFPQEVGRRIGTDHHCWDLQLMETQLDIKNKCGPIP